MPLNADARLVLDLVKAQDLPPVESMSPADARAQHAERTPPVLEPCHTIRDVDAGGVPARLYLPEPTESSPGLLVWFHGGGWVLGSVARSDATGHALARRSGQAVLSVDYRLAPEHPFPAPFDDSVAATRWAFDHAADLGIEAARIAVGGDSAGANLAAAVCHAGVGPVVGQVLVYPVTDCTMSSDSYQSNGDGYLLTRDAMQWFIESYLGGTAADDPRVSPLLADDATIAASPPAFVITAGYDPLRDEGIAYAERLAENGVGVNHLHYPGQIHAFFSNAHVMADARSALAATAQAVAELLS
ncbi:MAG: alpha/beta hydrolase [Ilumatobacter sp.]